MTVLSYALAGPPPLDGSYRGPLCIEVPAKGPRPKRIRDDHLESLLETGWLPEWVISRGYHRHGQLDPSRMFVAERWLLDGPQVRTVLNQHARSRKALVLHDRARDLIDSEVLARSIRPANVPTTASEREQEARQEAEVRFLEAICRFNQGRSEERRTSP